MHLKSLTLKGFKSFASSTTLRFEPGITCVVGPNGSGKSNVVDALTWVMGEQGAKALRGGKMEDVIFAGTSGRAPLGRAEVTLTIDNSDGALPIDYSEVSVTRRMFRDGAGEYEINGSACRLMDVQELLSDSGIGREMHVIVGQGRLAAILESRPEERRAFIEEAAGVLKHRKRKEKAVRKLDSMQANLARLTDLTAELRRQLKPLGRQAEVARRAATVQADLRDARLRLAADDLVILRAEFADQSGSEQAIREHQDRVAAELDQCTEKVARAESALAQITPAAGAAGEAWFRLSALQERVGATRRIAVERSRYLGESTAVETGRDPDELEAQAEVAAQTEMERTEEVEMASVALATAQQMLAECESAATAAEQAHMAAVRAVADRREGLARLEGQVANLRTKADSVDSELERLRGAIENAGGRADEALSEQEAVQARVAELEGSEVGLDEHHERSVAALTGADERVAEIQAAERETSQQIASLRARIDALAIGLERKDGGAWLLENHEGQGLSGPLAAMLTVHDGYEAAIAAALGPAAEAIAVADRGSARSALASLKKADGGRAALVVGGVAAPAAAPSISLPPGVRWATSVVTAGDAVRGAIGLLLADTLVADSLDVAADVIERLGADVAVRAVTVDGDLVGRGWMVGGSERKQSTIEVQSSIDRAKADLVVAERRSEELQAALAGAVAEQQSRREIASEALAALHESDAQLGAVYEQLGRLGQAVRTAREEQARLVAQRAKIESNRDESLTALTALQDRLRIAQDESSGVESDDVLPTTDRDMAAQALTEARAAEVEMRLAQRSAEEQLAAVRGRAESLLRAARAERDARVRAERRDAARRHAAAVAEVVAGCSDQVLSRLEVAVQRAQRQRDDLERQRTERNDELTEAKKAAAELTSTLDSLREAAHRDEVARAQAQMRIEQAEENVAATFAVAPDDLIAEYGPDVPLPPSELEQAEYEQARERGEIVMAPQPMPYDRATQEARAKKAQKDLNTLGKVNPLALEEFAALEERYNFLSTQLEDVKSARKDLLDVVDDVDARILQVFTEAYADVEREFVEVFKTLFPGGEGRLVLTDPSDMLTTGIEVEARPPGKKVKRLSLLSGGEKSLTAVAMLVAIFRARPSPFYVMDEVEAALDDTNLRRLISLFEQLREKSQLIVITHQKPTMEVADALYGVSMRGDGITTVISQRMRGQELGAQPVTVDD